MDDIIYPFDRLLTLIMDFYICYFWLFSGVQYDVRKNFADSRLRFKGRFVKKEDEELMRAAMEIC